MTGLGTVPVSVDLGAAGAGAVAEFRLSGWTVAEADGRILPPAPETVTLDDAGTGTADLIPNDNADLQAGTSWQVTITGIAGLPPERWSFVLTADDGGSPSLASLTRVFPQPSMAEGGAVASVNAQTGAVVLTAADVGADASGAAAAAQTAAQGHADTAAAAAQTAAEAAATAAISGLHLGTASTHAAGDFDASGAAAAAQAAAETAATAAITALDLGTAATHAASDFDAAGAAAVAQAAAEAAATAAITALGLGTAATHAATDFDAAGSASTAQATAEAHADTAVAGVTLASLGAAAASALTAETGRAETAEAGALQKTANLSDLASAATARASLGLTWKDPVQQVTTGALPANTYASGPETLTATGNGALTVDGVAVVAGQRILVSQQATAQNNGIYVVTQAGDASHPYILTRAPDMAAGSQVTGATVMVEQGSTQAGTGWFVEGAGPDTIGTTAIFWTKFTVIISGVTPQALGTAAPGTSGNAADNAHVHPFPGVLPADHGLLAWFCDPSGVSASQLMTAGSVYLMKIPIRSAITVSTLWFNIITAGAGASTGSFAGLYSSAGALLTGSADIGASLTSTGAKSVALTTPQALAAGSFVWAALVVNLASTQPTIRSGYGNSAAFANTNLSASAFRAALNGITQTSLPGTITPGSSAAGVPFWIGAS